MTYSVPHYLHEANRRSSALKSVKQPKRNPDRQKSLDRYVLARDIMVADDIHKFSYPNVEYALANHTRRTGQTFIRVSYGLWIKGAMVDRDPIKRGQRRIIKPVYRGFSRICSDCDVNRIHPNSKTGRCARCGQTARRK